MVTTCVGRRSAGESSSSPIRVWCCSVSTTGKVWVDSGRVCLRYSLFPSAKEAATHLLPNNVLLFFFLKKTKHKIMARERARRWSAQKEPRGNAGFDALVFLVDVGSSYHCEAEFTKRWIVHPLNSTRVSLKIRCIPCWWG